MKAIIPVAGRGTRLRPLTFTQPKALIRVAGRPILGIIVDQLQQAGVDEFVFVIGYLGDKIKDYIGSAFPNLKVDYVLQSETLGLGHAIWECRNILDLNEPVLILLGDTIVDIDFNAFLSSPKSCLGVKKVHDPRLFGVAEIDEDGSIVSVVEKPSIPKSNMAIVGMYWIRETATLMAGIQQNIDEDYRTNDEYQLTDGLMRMLESGVEMTTYNVSQWHDLGQSEVLLETNANLLKQARYQYDNADQNNTTVIIPPVNIDPSAVVNHSIIGPNVTIGAHAMIQSAIVRDSIIGDYSLLREVNLSDSIIGSDVSISGLNQKLNIGDNTEIDLSGGRA